MADEDASIKRNVTARFGAVAQNYVASATHADGDDLNEMVELAACTGTELVLDIATGGGHTALRFARAAAHVTATDLSPEMLAAAEAFLAREGAANVSFSVADAEGLPFADESFHLVTCRVAAHHFPQPARFIREAARVLKQHGLLVLNDNMAPEDDELDAYMNRFEKWRDPGHVRAWRISEWKQLIEAAGMRIEHAAPLSLKQYDFDDWAARIGMEKAEVPRLQSWLIHSTPRCKEFFEVHVENGLVTSLCGTFSIVVGRKHGG